MNKPRTFLPVCFSDRIPSVLFFALLSIATVFALYCLQSCGDSSLSPQSQPPIVTDIPDQTIREGELFATISLDNYVDDPDDADSEITWTFRGSDSLTVSVDEARVATINPPSLEWNGCDTLIFTAADPSGNRASSSGVFTVTGVNDAPIVQYIPNQYAYETFAFEPIALEDCVLDYDNTDAEIVWTCTGNIDLDVSIISYLFAVVSVPYPGWTGQETITLRATDPAGLSDERSATFTVIPVTHDPLVRDDWPVSTPEEQGVSGDLVHDTYLEAMHLEGLYSLLVIKNGYLVAERYFNDAYVDMAPSVASVTKSFTSALTGLALRDGHLTSLDQKMVDFFPELDWAGTDLRKGDITIRQMLQMRSGYPAEAVGGYLDELMAYDFDWIPVLIDFPLTNEPGTAFGYSSLTSHMLAVILARASGTDLYTFARINLLDPLECGQVYWPADLRGYYVGHGDVCMRPRDMAKFGLLYLNGGVYKGTQIIPADWVTESLTPYSHDVYGGDPLDYMTNISYGYLWWTAEAGGHGIKLARGFGGQLIVIVPDLDMVVVTSALITNLWDPESSTRSKAIQEMVGKFISSQ